VALAGTLAVRTEMALRRTAGRRRRSEAVFSKGSRLVYFQGGPSVGSPWGYFEGRYVHTGHPWVRQIAIPGETDHATIHRQRHCLRSGATTRHSAPDTRIRDSFKNSSSKPAHDTDHPGGSRRFPSKIEHNPDGKVPNGAFHPFHGHGCGPTGERLDDRRKRCKSARARGLLSAQRSHVWKATKAKGREGEACLRKRQIS